MTAAADDLGALASMAGLPGMGPRRMAAVLAEWTPAAAWHAIGAGRLRLRAEGGTAFPGRQLHRLGQIWADEAHRCRPDQLLHRCETLGVEVLPYSAPGYPERLRSDPEPPLVLFARGDLGALDAPAVAIVGTRRASPYGVDAAAELAGDLAEAGVAVISGLAVGIDGAAHRGALRSGGAAVVGVVASGLDVVYPRRHTELWSEVAERGLLLSEAPPGTAPEAWRFPARNRIIAGLAQVVVVVESPTHGGSMITVEEAIRRERPVMAVPGSINSPLSAGTNTLIFDGGTPVRSADDVLAQLGWPGGSGTGPRRPATTCPSIVAPLRLEASTPGATPAVGAAPASGAPAVAGARAPTGRSAAPDGSVAGARAATRRSAPPAGSGDESLGPDERAVLEALGWERATLDDVARRTRMALPAVIVALESLIRRGTVRREAGELQRRRPPAPRTRSP